MFASFTLTTLLAASLAIAAPLRSVQPREYTQDADLLENYDTYNARYTALGCANQHGKAFFDSCCHPLLKDEDASALPSTCTASPTTSSSASVTTPTPAPGNDEDDNGCDDETTTSISISTNTAPLNVGNPIPSSTKVPETTSAAPKTTHTPKPTPSPTTSKSEPKPTTSAVSNGSGAVNKGGFATWFLQNGVAGACGTVHGEDDLIVAIDQDRYGDSGEKSKLCGKQVKITNTNNNKSVVATIADDCPSCTNGNSIDLSQGTFQQIATLDEGEVPIDWVFL